MKKLTILTGGHSKYPGRTYVTHKHLYVSLVFPTIFGPIYSGHPPVIVSKMKTGDMLRELCVCGGGGMIRVGSRRHGGKDSSGTGGEKMTSAPACCCRGRSREDTGGKQVVPALTVLSSCYGCR